MFKFRIQIWDHHCLWILLTPFLNTFSCCETILNWIKICLSLFSFSCLFSRSKTKQITIIKKCMLCPVTLRLFFPDKISHFSLIVLRMIYVNLFTLLAVLLCADCGLNLFILDTDTFNRLVVSSAEQTSNSTVQFLSISLLPLYEFSNLLQLLCTSSIKEGL